MDFSLPPLGEGLYEVELIRWLVRPGDAVAHGEALMEVMSDKATMEVPSPFVGTITALAATPGTKVQVGQTILSYNPVGGAASQTATPAASKPPERLSTTQNLPLAPSLMVRSEGANGHSQVGTATKLPPAAPSVRILARKLGVDLSRVSGSGPHGRILLDDLTPYFKPSTPGTTPAAPGKMDTSKLDFGVAGTRVKLVGLRRRIAEHMVESTRTIPHYSYIDECDLTDLVNLRSQLRDSLARDGIKLTYLAFFVKAVTKALKAIPIVNSAYEDAAGEIVLHDRYNIGIAVAAPSGLIVPVIREADRKDLATIARDIDRLSSEAKAGRSRLEDLRGGTFTITSVGSIGGLISTPIINHPEVGILGIGKVVKRPVYDAAGNIRPADIVYLSFSFDHRIVDGAIVAAFGNVVMEHLHNPALLLLPEQRGV